MKYFIGVDGGGSKTAYCLADELGNVIAKTTLGTSHYMQVGLDGLSDNQKTGVAELLNQSNLKLEDISACFVATGGYGAIKDDMVKLDEAIMSVMGDCPVKVGNDMENAHAGGLLGKMGINVIAGTGSIGLGINEKNESFSSGGWGTSFGGDEGSAYWIAHKILQEFSKEADSRKEKTEIYEYFTSKYDLKDPFDILKYTVGKDRALVAKFSKDCHELALMGNKKAIKIFKKAAKELAEVYIAIAKNLSFEKPILASYTGGVFSAGKFMIEPLKEELEDNKIKLITTGVNPLAGSLILAYRMAGIEISEEMINNLKNGIGN